MRHSRNMVAGAFVAVLLGVVGCSGDSAEESTTRACDAARELETALSDFEAALTPDATVAELRNARQRVADAQDALDEATEDVVEARADDVEEAWDRLDDAVDDVSGDQTVRDAADSLRDRAAAVKDSLAELVSEVEC